MFISAIIGFALALGIFCLIQSMKKAVFSPVPRGKNMHFSTVIAVSGSAPELEAAVKSLGFLRSSGVLDTEIVLRDCGMDEETALVAEKLSRKDGLKLII